MRGIPYLPSGRARVGRQLLAFGGLNFSQDYREGELSDCEGLSSERFPCLSQRAGRKVVERYESPTALFAAGKLCLVDGTMFRYDGMNEGGCTAGKKKFAAINTKIVMFPDKLCFDTATGVLSRLEARYTVLAGNGSFTTSTLTVDADHEEFGDFFREGDAVELTGCISHPGNNGRHIIRGVNGRVLEFDADSLEAGQDNGALVIQRDVPDFDCVCESDNRLWGAAGSTIYASALGDPTNFFVYDGLSTDSYAAAVGSPGEFTGCCAFGGAVLFWKEDCLHKVLGGYPAQYEIYTYYLPGVEKGSEKSLVRINETLFYKGREGFYAYAGGSPEGISRCFGQRGFSGAVGGTDGVRYYVSMREDESGDWGLYVYDPARNLWLREDGTRALDFARLEGTLYYLDADSGALVMTGQDRGEEGRIAWSALLCPFTEQGMEKKRYLRLTLRLRLARGAWARAEVREDSGVFREVWVSHNERERVAVIPLRTGRCDSFELRLSGKGECLLEGLEREYLTGSRF